MPGDTKIKRAPGGWIDVDAPSAVHFTRWQARNARRLRLSNTTAPQRVPAAAMKAPSLQMPGLKLADNAPKGKNLTALQVKLLDRLTQRQGVSLTDATSVIIANGYNKAASYGHMREAGANHSEALTVIDLGDPAVSVAYGQARANGDDHTDALREALRVHGD